MRELLSRGVHPTASDILAIARRRVPGISLATVYNALREFERAPLNGVKVEPHLNIICNGEVREVDGAEVWRRIEELGFKPLAAVARC
ncbi:MAG: transcriptional repressor [Nanopusillaceae archaeon]